MSIPETITEFHKNFIFVSIWYIVEDRRPDLTMEEAQTLMGYKYKTQLTVNLFLKTYSFVFRTVNLPYIGVFIRKTL